MKSPQISLVESIALSDSNHHRKNAGLWRQAADFGRPRSGRYVGNGQNRRDCATAVIGQHFMLQQRSGLRPLPNHSFKPIRCLLLSPGADMRRREFLGARGGAGQQATGAEIADADRGLIG